MMEFGEKLKQLREEKGMTQQTIAEKLYVTRQAVSRWECGARYPDLLTAKKIAQILNASLDEMLSGEELKQNVEKEPVLAKPVQNIIQTVLYTVAVVAFLLMCIFSTYSFFPGQLAKHPVNAVSLTSIKVVLGYYLSLLAVVIGLVLSVQNKLTAKLTGIIMCIPYGKAALGFLIDSLNTEINGSWYTSIEGWITDFFMPLAFALCILLFFSMEKRRLPFGVISVICILTCGYIALAYRHRLMWAADLGFVVATVHLLGKIGMAILLGYQAYIWNQKRKKAYKSS